MSSDNNINSLHREGLSQIGQKVFTTKHILKFIIPSLIGIFLFLTPLPYEGKFTVAIGIMIDWIEGLLGNYLPAIAVIIICASTFISIIYKLFKPEIIKQSKFLTSLFDPTPAYMIMRILGSTFVIMAYYKIGTEVIWGASTGGTMLGLEKVLISNFFLCGLLMPLLLDFGCMDYFGTIIRKFMKPIFTIPGRSAIDCIASFIGNGSVGVVITKKQYDQGYYTGREAAVIATCFSVVSIAFCLVVAKFMKVDHLFIMLYLSVVGISTLLAIIIPRVPPLSKIKDEYSSAGKQIIEEVPEGVSRYRWAFEKGVEKAAQNDNWIKVAQSGLETVIDIYVNLLPIVMAGGTLALIVVEFTPVFNIISYPFVYILQWLQVPFAAEAAPAMVTGFADMFLPPIIGSQIASEFTRFVVAIMSLVQLIFMTEIGMIIIKSDIPLNFVDLLFVFLQRTAIALPIAVAIAHMIF